MYCGNQVVVFGKAKTGARIKNTTTPAGTSGFQRGRAGA